MEVNVKEIDAEITKSESEIDELKKLIEDAETNISILDERINELKKFKESYQKLNEDFEKLFGEKMKGENAREVEEQSHDENKEEQTGESARVDGGEEKKEFSTEPQDETVVIGTKNNDDVSKVVIKKSFFNS